VPTVDVRREFAVLNLDNADHTMFCFAASRSLVNKVQLVAYLVAAGSFTGGTCFFVFPLFACDDKEIQGTSRGGCLAGRKRFLS